MDETNREEPYRMIPDHVKSKLGSCNFSYAICSGCGNPSSSVHREVQVDAHNILKLSCQIHGCKVSSWYVCLGCNKRLGRSGMRTHVNSRYHCPQTFPYTPVSQLSVPSSPLSSTLGNNCTFESRTSGARQPTRCSSGIAQLAGAHLEGHKNANSPSFGSPNITTTNTTIITPSYTRHSFEQENQWLKDAFSHLDTVSIDEIKDSFGPNEKMALFWIAENASPSNSCGGGAQYLVGRAFSQYVMLTENQVPTITESKFHILSFIQFQSMSAKQRKRQAEIQAFTLANGFQAGIYSSLQFQHLGKVYCSNDRHSLWTNLPIPIVENINGISYVTPLKQIQFAFANGIPFEDLVLDESFFSDENQRRRQRRRDGTDLIFHISESLAVDEAMTAIASARLEAGVLNEPILLITHFSWRDGFASNRTKNNRESPLLWTTSFGSPKGKSNSGANTFVLAVGKKNNPSWHTLLEHRFHNDMKVLTDPLNPHYVYHSGERKVIPVVVMEVAAIEDKPERAAITRTLDGGNYHQCFSKLVQLSNPKLDRGAVLQFLDSSKKGEIPLSWGWTEQFMDMDASSGCRFPSCFMCRRYRLVKLGMATDSPTLKPQCIQCADWNLDDPQRAERLKFRPPPNYPKKPADDNCPIPFPHGREPGTEDLPVVSGLSFEYLIQASRVAFYHSSRRSKGSWNQGQCVDYLKTCGINRSMSNKVHQAAVKHRTSIGEIDYGCPSGLGNYLKFPASWVGSVRLTDYIETVMHQVFIGCAQSNMGIIDNCLKCNNWGVETFRRSSQELLEELKKFGLSWLPVMPFNSSKKSDDEKATSHTTGSWMGENWGAYIRISNILYTWVYRDLNNSRAGAMEIGRMVVAYHAFISRLLTHSGMNRKKIDRCDDFLKEFLSCVQELDVRANHPHNLESSPTPKKNKKTSKKKRKLDTTRGVQQSGTATPLVKSKPVQYKPTWYNQNYLSLFNLTTMLERHGPVVLYWDGAGMGEKGIPTVKPHIKHGVPSYPEFFPNVTRRLYKVRQMGYFEKMYLPDQFVHTISPYTEDRLRTLTVTEELEKLTLDDGSVDNATVTVQDYTDAEDEMMSKSRTTFTYKTTTRFIEAVTSNKPISGILVDEGNGLEMYCVVRTYKQNSLGWSKITFDDSSGVWMNGLWYSPITYSNISESNCPSNLEEIQSRAKMSGVAIPLWYVLGKEHPNAYKYCVITNWWKPRHPYNRYMLPSIDFQCYQTVPQSGIEMMIADNEVLPPAPLLQASELGASIASGGSPACTTEVRRKFATV